MHSLLGFFRQPTAVEALELLDSKFPDAKVSATLFSVVFCSVYSVLIAFQVRDHAVECLEALSHDELLDYLLQLVQVIKYETYHDSGTLSSISLAPFKPDSDTAIYEQLYYPSSSGSFPATEGPRESPHWFECLPLPLHARLFS